jgi:hypothetical protein
MTENKKPSENLTEGGQISPPLPGRKGQISPIQDLEPHLTPVVPPPPPKDENTGKE